MSQMIYSPPAAMIPASSTVQIEELDGVNVPVPEDNYILELEEDLKQESNLQVLMVDSGAYIHVCPPTFMPEIPLRSVATPPEALAATGQPLQFYGMRKVECEAWQGVHLTLDFSVMNVSRPILSVGALV